MIGILCGLQSEKKIVSKIPNSIVLCSGSNPDVGRNLALELVDRGVDFLMSFGVAGALSPDLSAGDIVVGKKVVSSYASWECDSVTAQRLLLVLPRTRLVSVYGSENLVSSPAAKNKIYSATGCHIVDMESQCVAQIACQYSIPFIVVRAVCDDAETRLPSSVTKSVRTDGSVDVMQSVKNILAEPKDIFRVMSLAINMKKATSSLYGVCKSMLASKNMFMLSRR